MAELSRVNLQTTSGSERALRYFVSYRRSAERDARLAAYLVQSLRAAGREVFVDVDMSVGVEWSAEIDRRIDWADYMVVLLSEESVCSEMVQAEVRRAHRASQAMQRSKILPVRVDFSGRLGYELDSYLGRLHYVLWNGEHDNERVAAEVLRAQPLDPAPLAAPAPLDPAQPAAATVSRPEPKADMRLLRQTVETPGSPVSYDNPAYVRRDADQRVDEAALGRTRTVVIKGPNQTGKSSLLLRYLAKCLDAGKQVAFVDFMTFGTVRKLSFPEFATQFVQVLLDELGIRDCKPPDFKRAMDLTHFMEDVIFTQVDGALVLAIDEADRAIGSDWQEDFYSTLRSWDGNRAHPGKKKTWGRLGLALVIATDPKMLIESGYTSPFNVTPPITLGAFPREALDAFNACFANLLSSAQLDRLYLLLRGHPYLTPLAFYRLVYDESSFERMDADADQEFGPFGDHLRSRLDRLHSAGLVDAMRSILRSGSVPNNDRRLFYRLEAAGLVCEDAGRIVTSNELYERFFKAVV